MPLDCRRESRDIREGSSAPSQPKKMESRNFTSSGEDSRSVVSRFQQRYWKTKQTLIRASGKEDQHVVASDAELDAKLEVFHSIQRTCMELLKVIEQYQRRICFLSQEENELGRFLRSQGSQDKSRAGKIMQATGKALCFSSQQRMALRKPLCRLYQEVETFRFRAVSDTWLTVKRMEHGRTEYRSTLLWMKDVSAELDPDARKHMDKFRKVQAEVRAAKLCFDQLKTDVCQKVDLLGASRCNLLSHVLATYQSTLLHFWEKTSHNMAAIHENFKGCPRYEEPSRGKKRKKTKAETQDEDKSTQDELVTLGNDDSSSPTKEGEACVPSWDEDKDSLALLEEILGGVSLQDSAPLPDPASPQWSPVFDEAQDGTDMDPHSVFLPSQLLDSNLKMLQSVQLSEGEGTTAQSVATATTHPQGDGGVKGTQASHRGPSKDLSAWFNLFADLDPLANPDAVGKSQDEQQLHNA
ncbi:islet cell autoantigen 1 isoform X2 [Corythoichthys intestinalis]|uniref:islet cell autoantigen 1 isoform X2 n=1 Tax=Corythoichthys intestinalis TaxID=161448 RepID=UPI0025A5C711|nr:islet cell autoantigen 1 isoform X2 [Corythoichthys intestinalis]